MQTLLKKNSKILIIIVALLLMLISSIPSYLTKNWLWEEIPIVKNLGQIKSLKETGLELPEWQIIDQAEVQIGGHKWSYQLSEKDPETTILLFLFPPNDLHDKPEVEWTDMNGFQKWDFSSKSSQRWKTDSYQHLNLKFADQSLKTRFFRAWNRTQTFAVVQWYAFPNGGNPSPSIWFWSDLFAQLHQKRIPWIAVSLQIPIEPLGDIEKSKTQAESLVKIIQESLTEKYLNTK